MACRAIESWTVSSLIGSYIDLAFAYLLLLGSTLAFLSSKFLSFFGLHLPCPCHDGLFHHPNCTIQTLFVDSPTSQIASIHSTVKTHFPFHSSRQQSDKDKEIVVAPRRAPVVVQSLRRRRRKSSSSSLKGRSSSFKSLSWKEEEVADNFFCNSSRKCFEEQGSTVGGFGDWNGLVDEVASATEFYSVEKDTPPSVKNVHVSEGKEAMIIKSLERELEEAQADYTALYVELEKERVAAASAADEAMAMILRLQNEKAALLMEARQNERMIEEKASYDEEEMEILKEIIVKREKEKHVLEKEIEAYRQMMLSGEISGDKFYSSFDSYDDPTLILKTIHQSIGRKEKVKDKMKWIDADVGKQCLESPGFGDVCNLDFQEKGMLTTEVYPSSGQCPSSGSGEDSVKHKFGKIRESGLCKKTCCSAGEQNVEIGTLFDDFGKDGDQDAHQGRLDSSQYETESSVLDVHVVDDQYNLGDERNGREDVSDIGCASQLTGKVDTTDELPVINSFDISTTNPDVSWVGGDVRRSCSDMTMGGQLIDGLSDKASHFDSRRSSMSAVDSERDKLETEVEVLRKRLKTIQQGREKLSFPVEHREKENFQLQLLEDIACQLQQIRKITEPGKSVRQASLPPQSSKINPKKRRCRSVSWGLHESA